MRIVTFVPTALFAFACGSGCGINERWDGPAPIPLRTDSPSIRPLLPQAADFWNAHVGFRLYKLGDEGVLVYNDARDETYFGMVTGQDISVSLYTKNVLTLAHELGHVAGLNHREPPDARYLMDEYASGFMLDWSDVIAITENYAK